MAKVLGVDVFAGYGQIDFVKARAAGVRFVIAQCATGNDPIKDDGRYHSYLDGARAAGIIAGDYFFFYGLRAGVSPKTGKPYPLGRSGLEQADRYWAVSRGRGARIGELPPMLDLEWPVRFRKNPNADPADPKTKFIDQWEHLETDADIIVDGALEWLDRIETLSNRIPIVYIFPDFAHQLSAAKNFTQLSRYWLAIAAYADKNARRVIPDDDDDLPTVAPWARSVIHQFSADNSPMRIDGVQACPVDRDCMRSVDELAALAGIDASDIA